MSSGRSLHEQVRRDLLSKIVGGEYKFGEMLPSEDMLCDQYGVSRITVRRAINDLASQFMLSRRRGVGTVVRYNGARKCVFHLTGFFEDHSSLSQRVFDDVHVPADDEVARKLNVKSGTRVRRVRLVTHREKELFTLATNYYGANERATALGVRIDRATQELRPDLADEWTASKLGIAVGTPLLSAKRTYVDQNGAPVRYLYARYHPEHYRFVIDLQARSGCSILDGNVP